MKSTIFILIIYLLLSMVNLSTAQTAGDYRTKQTGSWHVAASWQMYNGTAWVDATTFPSYANGTITILLGHIITSSGTDTADQVIVNSGGTINITAGTFTVADGAGTDLDCNGTVTFSSGTLNGTGTVSFNAGSTFNWTGGTNGGSGTMTINANAALNMSGSSVNLADTKVLNNYGIWTWTGSTFNFNSGAPAVNNYGTFNIYTDADVTTSNSSTGSFNNMPTGIINKIGSPNSETSFDGTTTFTNTGAINLNASRIRLNMNATSTGAVHIAFGANLTLSSKTTIFNTGTVLTGDGNLNIDGATTMLNAGSVSIKSINITSGTLTLAAALVINTDHTLNISSGTINGAGDITFNSGSTLNWNGGTIGGSGVLTVNKGAVLTMNGSSVNLADTRILNNYGDWTWTGATFLYSNGSPVVNNYGTFNINTNGNVSNSNTTTASFNNRPGGVINKTGSIDNTTSFSGISTFSNGGTINVNSGELEIDVTSVDSGTFNIAYGAYLDFTQGTATFNTGTILSGEGYLSFNGATVNMNAGLIAVGNLSISNGTVTLTPNLSFNNGNTLNLSGNSTLKGTGNITFNTGSAFNWTSGTLGGSGILTLNYGATFTMSNSIHYLADTRTINNYGIWTWNGGNLNYFNGSPVINNYGTFNVNSDYIVSSNNTNTGSFNNKAGGIINKIGSPDNFTSFSGFSTFSNAGAININSGGLLIINLGGTHTGTYNIAFGGLLGGSSTNMLFTGTSFTNNGSVTLSGLSFNGSAAQAINGTGSINSLTINNANGITLGGTQTINNSFTLTNGKVTLGDNDLLVGATATFTGGNAANYIVTNGRGSLQRRVLNNATNVLFPVGSATSYMPASIQLTTTSVMDDFRARVLPNIYGSYDSISNNTIGSAITANSVNGTWFISEATPGGSNGTLTIQWNAANEATGFIRAASRFAQYTLGSWNLAASAAATGTNPYTSTRSGLTSFSFFAVTNQFVTSTTNFAAVCSGSTIKIPYNAVGNFNAGNTFTAQLSDSTGNFVSPISIGSLAKTTSDTISGTIPATTLRGSGYKIRIVSSAPALTGPPNPSSIPIRACTTPLVVTKPCTVPTGLKATNVYGFGVQLIWNGVSIANAYEVQFRRQSAPGWTSFNVTSPTLSVDTLHANTTYEAKVRATCGTGFSDFSNVLTFTTDNPFVTPGPKISGNRLSIYPNPNNGVFIIQMRFKETKALNATIQIRNTAGQVVYNEKTPVTGNELKKAIFLNSTINSGIYFITIEAGTSVYYDKVNYQKR